MQQQYVILYCVAGMMTTFSAQAENTVTAASISGALGGLYQYHNGASVGGVEQDSNLGGYRQQFDVPYMGVSGIVRYQNVELSALAKYSLWVKARDNDEHSFRQLSFRDEGNDGRYYSVLVDIGYYLTSCARLFTTLSWHKYDESRGGTHIIDQVSGDQGYIGGHAAGITNEYYTVTAGLTYRF